MHTRQHCNFHQPLPSLIKLQKGVYYLGIKVFSHLPSYVKTVSDDCKQFKSILKNFCIHIPFIV